MVLELLVHVERCEGETVWWTESPQVEGFTAADSSLQQTILRSKLALIEMAAEGLIEEDFELQVTLAPLPPDTSNDSTQSTETSSGESAILAFA